MTPFTPIQRVQNALTYLSAARQAGTDDETAGVYMLALTDVDPALIERACYQLAQEDRTAFDPAMPTVGAIRTRAHELGKLDEAAALKAKLLPAPKANGDEPTYFCVDCFDEPSGWRFFYCRGKGDAPLTPTPDRMTDYPCSRLKSHQPHPYVERCACLPTNPVSAQARERMRVSQLKRTTKHDGRAA